MYNGTCIESDGSVLPANMTIEENNFLGTIIKIEDYHGNIKTFITSRSELESLLEELES